MLDLTHIPSRSRDSQRQKLYKAERRHSLNSEKPFDYFEEVEAYAKHVIDELRKANPTLAMRKGWLHKYPDVKRKAGAGRAYAKSSGSIHMPKWSWTRLIIVHELAHLVAGNEHQHHVGFANVYVKLLGYAVNIEAAAELANCFNAGRVAYLPDETQQRHLWRAAAAQQPKLKLKPRERFLNAKINELDHLISSMNGDPNNDNWVNRNEVLAIINSLRTRKEI